MTDTREAIDRAIGEIVRNASNFPDKVQARLLGQDMAPLRKRLTDAVLATLSTPPADDVREALSGVIRAHALTAHIFGKVDAGELADAIRSTFEVRPRGTVTDAERYATALRAIADGDGPDFVREFARDTLKDRS